MRTIAKTVIAALLLTGGTAAIADADLSSVNKGIRVESNRSAGDVDTVNGSINIGEFASVGRVESVNGGVRLGEGVTARSVESVNGTVRFGEGVVIDGNVETVNGAVRTEPGAEIRGTVSTVNGVIDLEGALVNEDIISYNGGISLVGTTVEGSLHVKKPKNGWFSSKRQKPVRVEIGPGTTIQGNLYFDRPVELFIDGDANVGEILGDEITMRERK
ncbi:MAG: hypothetical protein AAGE01_04070 [Pseudomonadota bacterium]